MIHYLAGSKDPTIGDGWNTDSHRQSGRPIVKTSPEMNSQAIPVG